MIRFVRQRESESRPFAYHRRNRDFATQPFNDCFTDRQSQSCALRVVVQFGKAFEHTFYFLRFDARTGVSHVENNLLVHQLVSVADAARLCEFERVAYQVREHLEHPVLVSLYHQTIFGWFVD